MTAGELGHEQTMATAHAASRDLRRLLRRFLEGYCLSACCRRRSSARSATATTLSAEEIALHRRGITDGSLTEGQVAAFAMAVFFRGMTTASGWR